MLIICNGAFKSGSSWLHAIIKELLLIRGVNLTKIPDKYTNDTTSPTKIVESKLFRFISEQDPDNNHYITKSHFFKDRTLIRNYPKSVKFLFIERDMKDAIVSHYYHIQHKFGLKISFNLYYYFIGRYKAYEIRLFNKKCKHYFGSGHFLHYHDLKNSFAESIHRLCAILDLQPLQEDELKILERNTSLESLRKKSKKGVAQYYPSKRKDNWKNFRKGKEGEWMHYFSKFQLNQINNIDNSGLILRVIYFFLFTTRRFLGNIE